MELATNEPQKIDGGLASTSTCAEFRRGPFYPSGFAWGPHF